MTGPSASAPSGAVRIQRSRARGWRMPEGAVYVGRPSRWGNPYRVGDPVVLRSFLGTTTSTLTARQAVDLFRRDFAKSLPVEELRGRDLACWCPLDQPCHADVLLDLANPTNAQEGT